MGIRRLIFATAVVLGITPALQAQTYPTGSDPRNNLRSGKTDAEIAAKGMKLVSFTGKPAEFDSASGLNFINSDLAFKGNLVVQGNFMGFMIWDVSNPAKPVRLSTVVCQTSQGDPSIYGNLLFVSAEGNANRDDCKKGGVDSTESPTAHFRGVRIYDISNPRAPKLVKNVETCKGSHTHTIIPHKSDKNIIYIYISGGNAPRSEAELPGGGCIAKDDPADETNSRFRLDVIKVPLNKPTDAAVVAGARIFTGLAPAQRRTGGAGRGGRGGRGGADTTPPPAVPPPSSQNCHDVTVYPEMNLLAGACQSYGILVDISNPEKPVRLDAVSDTTFSLWHTAVFSNDGKKVVFTDEWGGGTSPMCQATSMMQQGGNTTLSIGEDKKYTQRGYFKLPSAQTAQENCVSHNGGVLPIPGRDVMVQGWYQGGVNLIDFTDADKPVEIGYFDRGPVDPPPMVDVPGAPAPAAGGRGGPRSATGGSWGAYYFNGYIYSSELARGFDVMELTPTENLSVNEIAAAKLVRYEQYNPQSQPKMVWPAAFPVVRSYVDQLARNQGLAAERITAINTSIDAAEKLSGAARSSALTTLAGQVDKDVTVAKDTAKVRTLAAEIRRLAAVK
jgi:hypothetical protein